MGLAKDFIFFYETFYLPWPPPRHRLCRAAFLAGPVSRDTVKPVRPPRHPRVRIDDEGAIIQVLACELWAEKCWEYDPAADTLASAGSPECEAKMYSTEACIQHAPGPLGKQALFETVMPAMEACRTHNQTCDSPMLLH